MHVVFLTALVVLCCGQTCHPGCPSCPSKELPFCCGCGSEGSCQATECALACAVQSCADDTIGVTTAPAPTCIALPCIDIAPGPGCVSVEQFDSNHCPLCPKIECVNCAFAAPSPCAPVVVDDLGCLLRTTKLDRNNCRSCPVISCKSDCSINYRRIGILIDCNNCTCNPAGKLTCTSRTCRPAACRPAVVGCVNCTCESGVQVCSHGCNASAVVLIENLDLTIPILHDLLALFFVRHPDLGVPTLLGVEFVKNNISALVSLPVVASKKRDGLELMRSVFEENGYVGASYGTVSARTISVGPPITEPVVSGGLTSGMLAGIVIGVVMGVGLVVVLVGIGMTKRQKVAQKAVVTDAAAMTTNSMVTTNSVVIEDVHDFL